MKMNIPQYVLTVSQSVEMQNNISKDFDTLYFTAIFCILLVVHVLNSKGNFFLKQLLVTVCFDYD